MPTVTTNEETKPAAQSSRTVWLKQARQLHLYLGTFFAPSIIFFALTGALQLFGLHEGHPGEAYQPPAWIAKLGSIHKNQTLGERRGPPPGFGEARGRPPGFEEEEHRPPQSGDRQRRPGGEDQQRHESGFTSALKWFFLATSLGLVFTSLLGIYMAFKYNRSLTLIWGLLIAGTAIPAALIAMMA